MSGRARRRGVPWRRVAVAAATAGTVWGVSTGSAWTQRLFKPLIVASLAASVHPARDRTLVVGLAAAVVGDLWMIDPDDDAALQRGATAFAVMQCAYSRILIRRGASFTTGNAVLRFGGAALGAAVLARRDPHVAPVLSAYGCMLATTSTLAADPTMNAGPMSASKLELGGIAFTMSDALILGRRLFLTHESHRRVAECVIVATYALAQVLLVEELAQLERQPERSVEGLAAR